MILDHHQHPAVLSRLFNMADDHDLLGASEFVKGKFGVFNAVSLLLWVMGEETRINISTAEMVGFHSNMFHYL